MQELIDYMNLDLFTNAYDIREKANVLLEKEKEQIIEAYGRAICMFYESEQPEEYYNETFNQDRELPSDVKNILDTL